VRAFVRADDARTAALQAEGIELCRGDLRDPPSLVRALTGIDIVYNIGATYRQAAAGRSDYYAINARAVADLVEAGSAVACGGSCTAAPSACTATSRIRQPAKTRLCGRATSTSVPNSRARGSAGRRRVVTASIWSSPGRAASTALAIGAS